MSCLFKLASKILCETVVVLEIGDSSKKAKPCAKTLCATVRLLKKFASQSSAQLTFCLKLATFVNKLRLVQNTVRNCPVSSNRRQNTLRNCRSA